MKILVTGGAGFIGRWVVSNLLNSGHEVLVIDNLSNGRRENIAGLEKSKLFKGFFGKDIRDREFIDSFFEKNKIDICIHLAAQIDVQKSIDDPKTDFEINMGGTANLLQCSKNTQAKFVFVSSCMVYKACESAINENHPTVPLSPYAAGKIAGESLALSYYFSYNLPVTVLRPFNTYGPYQKSNMEGGVVSIFLDRKMKGLPLSVFGDGEQTRDFLYVTDCADFITEAALSEKSVGEIINAGSGRDVSINSLAKMIAGDVVKVEYIEHHHPQAEIRKLLCDYTKSRKLLGWEPKISLEEGIKLTEIWAKTKA